MRRLFLVAAGLAATAASVTTSAQESQFNPKAQGVLPPAAETPPAVGGMWPTNRFIRDPSGWLSRTVFETDEHPNFKLVIRDFSFPPDRQSHIIILPSGAFLHTGGGEVEVGVAKQRFKLSNVTRTAVPAGAPIQIVNNGERAVIVRALVVEPK